ncbi:hypothetical protein AB0J80_16710 [Actinoplanes sp. NPDC049548]|uniref:hypothetical protein n=1 Tax=Actinoplanes sp. NPDC049548 TaxID=3155152 RepID=UPI003440586B
MVTIAVAAVGTLTLLAIGSVSGWGSGAEGSTSPLAGYQPAPTIAYAGPSAAATPSAPVRRSSVAAAGSSAPTKVPAVLPARRTKAAPTSKPSPAPEPFSALAGFRCPETSSSGYAERVGTDGWYLVTGGGFTGNGCRGHMVAMPMSGDRDDDDLSNMMLWWFRMSPRADCAVEVYVPRTGNVRDAAGEPATYQVYATVDGSGSRTGRFVVDQVRNQGRWVPAGRFPATRGQLSVRLMTRGSSDIRGARLGGSAVRVSC